MPHAVVIEDNATVRETVASILEAAGFQVQAATNGASGIELVQREVPDIVICDIDMPQANGYTVAKEVRSNPTTASVPFIFLTGLSERRDVRRGMEYGADDYLTKPFTARELLAAVDAQLRKRSTIVSQYEDTMRLLRKNIIYALPHELRTSLTGSLGYAEVLRTDYETLAPEDIRDVAEKIVNYGKRLQRIIENYLIYAQIEITASDPVQLQALRNHLVRHCGPVIIETAQEIAIGENRLDDLKMEVESMALALSEANLKKIVLELVSNAFKFSQAGQPVHVWARRDDRVYCLDIQDFGRGMSPDQRQQIGAYMQFDRLLHEQQGMGLGLIIARRLTELHYGQFEIDSEPDQGTRVRIAFPLY